MYERTPIGWQLQQALLPTEPGTYADFGAKLAMSGDVIIASAVGRAPDFTRCVYIFRRDPVRNTWAQEQKLSLDPAHSDDSFGWSLSLTDHQLMVGAPFEDLPTHGGQYISNAGAAYIYEDTRSGWKLKQRLLAPLPSKDGFFGAQVTIAHGYAMVGKLNEPLELMNGRSLEGSGAVFIYMPRGDHYQSWKHIQTLTDPAPAAKGWFGSAVSTDGAWAIVGARGMPDTVGGASPAGVRLGYLYQRRGRKWKLREKIMTQGLLYHASEGKVVAISGAHAIAGAYMEADMKGSAYLLNRRGGGGWVSSKLIPARASPKAFFGISVDLSGDYAIIGAYQQDDGAGAAYVLPVTGLF